MHFLFFRIWLIKYAIRIQLHKLIIRKLSLDPRINWSRNEKRSGFSGDKESIIDTGIYIPKTIFFFNFYRQMFGA